MNILEQSKNEEFVKEQFIKGRILDDTKDFLEGNIIQKPNTNVSFEKDWNTIDRLNNNWYTYRLTVDNNITDTKFIYKSSLFNHNISIR